MSLFTILVDDFSSLPYLSVSACQTREFKLGGWKIEQLHHVSQPEDNSSVKTILIAKACSYNSAFYWKM